MKPSKMLSRIALAILLGALGGGFGWIWAVDGAGGGFNGSWMQLYPAPKTKAQLVVLSNADFQGDQDFYFGVRASTSEKWRKFHHSSIYSSNHMVWSSDGSVVALGDDTTVMGEVNRFHLAYDFRFDKIYRLTSNDSQSIIHRQISQLLRSRGGWQRSEDPLEQRNLSSWRWQDSNLKKLLYSFH